MTDVALNIINGCVQLKLENGDLAKDDGLETAILISLFSDRRVTDEELPVGISDKRGWWGDLFPTVQGDKIGSKIWLLERRGKVNNATLAEIESFATDALQWLLEDGVASSVEVIASLGDNNDINLSIKITKNDSSQNRFLFIWDGQEIRRG